MSPTPSSARSAPVRRRYVLLAPVFAVLVGLMITSGVAFAAGTPSVTSLSPSGGPTAGGTSVSIGGSNFTGATSVYFGATPTAFTVNSDSSITATAPAAASAGAVYVRVTNSSGTSAATSSNLYLYSGAATGYPAVSGLTPSSGPIGGGNSVTISGSGFLGATSVVFGSMPATFSVISDSQISAIAPASAYGVAVHVQVTNAAGPSAVTASDVYGYGGPVSTGPFVSALLPSSGPLQGGNSVTIRGYGFLNATSVHFDGAAANFSVDSDQEITAFAPPAAYPVTVYVTVTTPAGTSPSGTQSQYQYKVVPAGPVVSAITPISGPVGTTVILNGSNFNGATVVTFGGVPATFFVNSNIQITATAPAAAGSVYIKVTTPYGTSAATTAGLFSYTGGTLPPPPNITKPSVTSISPNSGPTTGGTTITVYGSGFTGTTSVLFGPTSASFNVISDSQLTVVSPPHAAGPIGIGVYNPAGNSDNTTADDYTYTGNVVIPPPSGPNYCPATPLWVDDLAYGSVGGGFYWDPMSGQVWTGQRGWHPFAPFPARQWKPMWVDALSYGSIGGGFWWDPTSGQVWTQERGWHLYGPTGCIRL